MQDHVKSGYGPEKNLVECMGSISQDCAKNPKGLCKISTRENHTVAYK